MLQQRQYTNIARTYAAALFHAAREEKALARVQEECRVLGEVLNRAEQRLLIYFGNPQAPTEDKLALVDKVFGPQFSPLMLRLLGMLLRRERIRYLHEILDLFRELVEAAGGIYPAFVQSAVALSAQDQARLKTALEKHTGYRLNIDFGVDPALIGGLVFRFRDTLIDSSLRTQLNRIGRRLLGASLQARDA